MNRILSLLLAFWTLTSVAASAQTRTAPTVSRTTDVTLSATGGTSKGSYQAGLDWTLVEFLRRTRRPDFVDLLRVNFFYQGGELSLKASSGASAGNVDALLAAISWCASSDGPAGKIEAEKSLFWKIW